MESFRQNRLMKVLSMLLILLLQLDMIDYIVRDCSGCQVRTESVSLYDNSTGAGTEQGALEEVFGLSNVVKNLKVYNVGGELLSVIDIELKQDYDSFFTDYYKIKTKASRRICQICCVYLI